VVHLTGRKKDEAREDETRVSSLGRGRRGVSFRSPSLGPRIWNWVLAGRSTPRPPGYRRSTSGVESASLSDREEGLIGGGEVKRREGEGESRES